MLQHLTCSDKSHLPVGITAQDRGQMTFPHKSLLSFYSNGKQSFQGISLSLLLPEIQNKADRGKMPHYLKCTVYVCVHVRVCIL